MNGDIAICNLILEVYIYEIVIVWCTVAISDK